MTGATSSLDPEALKRDILAALRGVAASEPSPATAGDDGASTAPATATADGGGSDSSDDDSSDGDSSDGDIARDAADSHFVQNYRTVAASARKAAAAMRSTKLTKKTFPDFLDNLMTVIASIDPENCVRLKAKDRGRSFLGFQIGKAKKPQTLDKVKAACVSIADTVAREHEEALQLLNEVGAELREAKNAKQIDDTRLSIQMQCMNLLRERSVAPHPWQRVAALYVADALAVSRRRTEDDRVIERMVSKIVAAAEAGADTTMELVDAAIHAVSREDIRRRRDVVTKNVVRALRRASELSVIADTNAHEVLVDAVNASILEDVVGYVIFSMERRLARIPGGGDAKTSFRSRFMSFAGGRKDAGAHEEDREDSGSESEYASESESESDSESEPEVDPVPRRGTSKKRVPPGRKSSA